MWESVCNYVFIKLLIAVVLVIFIQGRTFVDLMPVAWHSEYFVSSVREMVCN